MNKYFVLLFFFIFYLKISICENEKKEIFPDKELENIGGSAGDIISSSSRAPSKEHNETPDVNIAANILKGLKNIPPPIIQLNEDNLIDPEIICERDYNLPCPNDYNYIGFIHVTEDEICAPASTYDGPCKGEELNIKNMSEKTKETWSNKCQAFWPCKKCVRNFNSFCPEKWIKVKGTVRSCNPSTIYTGPCNFQMNFSGYNIRMLEEWSLKCKAWWKCDHLNFPDECPDKDSPITTAATKWRIKKNYQ
ncbi:CPW-WPC family protein, putative [Plasmodium relictum]|uniref:CPW-WPC family protein, putative n=1 Tax=Plasmodium relictum TaxID=85471 RepID=A0A1J1H6R9_PLARL|nr:CPW-WPC family protein, putative [Plasmodium relictum]CRH00355.1 CPW-WPC family protein, putative [Plasmodium relictum]